MSVEYGSVIDLANLIPLYYQVYLSVRARIASGDFAPGAVIPTEREFCEEFGVSRITITKGLDLLESEGLIERQRGRGTFVREDGARELRDAPGDLMVAFVCASISADPQASILASITRVLAKANISLLVLISGHSSDAEARCIERALARGADGIIILPCEDFKNAAYFLEVNGPRSSGCDDRPLLSEP